MKLYHYTPINYGIVVVCQNVGYLKNTVTSLNSHYPKHKLTVITEVANLPLMINKGIKESPCNEWNFIICANGWVRKKFDLKYCYFIESTKDILFPVIKNNKLNFLDCDISGLLLHKNAFLEIGDFPNTTMYNSKLLWSAAALEKGYKIKGVIGARI
jgi:hypothetical protein